MLPVPKEQFIAVAERIAAELGFQLIGSLKSFLQFAFDYPIVLNKKGGVALHEAKTTAEVHRYLRGLLPEYFKKRSGVVSLKDCQTIPDPAVDTVLESFAKKPKTELAGIIEHHRLAMAAENKIGDLLEVYLAEKLEPRGWFWCCCNVIKGVDFLRPPESRDPALLMQIKNRYNSENSSSEKIRDMLEEHGCPVKIQKWHRCNANGSTAWASFPSNADGAFATEDGFQKFLREYPGKH
jgi:hypothetical protein